MDDTIYRQAAIEEVHGAIYEFFDICDDDEESPMTYKDKRLLELNKAITLRIKQLPSVQSEQSEMIKDIRKWINSGNRGNADYFIVDKIEEIINKYER